MRINQLDATTHLRKRQRGPLLNLNADPIWQEAHHARRLDPRNLLELLLALFEGNEKYVAADVSSEHIHHLRAWNLVQAAHADVVARFHPKAPASRSVAVDAAIGDCSQRERCHRNYRDTNTARGLLRHCAFAHDNPPVGATKLQFWIGICQRRVSVELGIEFAAAL